MEKKKLVLNLTSKEVSLLRALVFKQIRRTLQEIRKRKKENQYYKGELVYYRSRLAIYEKIATQICNVID